MFVEATLIAWTAIGFIWWVVAWRLVATPPRSIPPNTVVGDDRFVTIFKPLAPLQTDGFHEAPGLESFIAQLDVRSEILLGMHSCDQERVTIFFERMRMKYPNARIDMIGRDEPDSMPNPKVAWLKILAPHARGELWLWSDADIVAPPRFLESARREYAASGVRMMTWPYVVQGVKTIPAFLDALFVNVEFFPGVLLLRRRGSVDFGLGAAMLFSRTDFEKHVGWDKIGQALADDFVMGQNMGPVRIGQSVLQTVAEAESWRAAMIHYLRWSKTVRWNRPLGTLARVIVLPVLGWMGIVAWNPSAAFGWFGLAITTQMDALCAFAICHRIGFRVPWKHLFTIELWTMGRAFAWLFCWFPWPVIWRGHAWWGPNSPTGRPPL